MKLHIENLHVSFPAPQPPAGLLAMLAIAGAAQAAAAIDVPEIGDKWPGTEATYAGKSLSLDGERIVHLILWDDQPEGGMEYAKAVKYAEQVNPEMSSHIPTRHQSITLFENLRNRFNQDHYHWTLTKTPSGKAAFLQLFYGGDQYLSFLSTECRVRAVSEIPL